MEPGCDQDTRDRSKRVEPRMRHTFIVAIIQNVGVPNTGSIVAYSYENVAYSNLSRLKHNPSCPIA